MIITQVNSRCLTKSEMAQLRRDICLGSLFYRDYENRFEIDTHTVCDFFDGFLEYAWEDAKEKYPEEMARDEFSCVMKHYDNIEELFDYYDGLEETPWLPMICQEEPDAEAA